MKRNVWADHPLFMPTVAELRRTPPEQFVSPYILPPTTKRRHACRECKRRRWVCSECGECRDCCNLRGKSPATLQVMRVIGSPCPGVIARGENRRRLR